MKNSVINFVKAFAVVALFAAPVFTAQAGTTHGPKQPGLIPWPPIVRPIV